MEKQLKIIFCALWLAAYPAWGAEPVQLPGAAVEELLALAQQNNPELAAMHLEAAAAAERIYPAGALPDPMLRAELMDITNAGTNAFPSLLPGRVGSTRYSALQAVPFWGKRDLKREMAEAEARQAQGRASLTWAELSARIKTDFAQYYLLSRNGKLTQEILGLLISLERIAQARYATGLAAQQDVIRAQVELTGLRSELVMLEAERYQAMARLNTLVRRAPDAPLAEPQRLRPIPDSARLHFAALEDRLRAKNPQLFTIDAQVTASEKNRELVLKNRYPDFIFGLSPTQVGGQIKEWGLMVELNIPLQQQTRRAQEREADTMLTAARSRKEAALNQLLGDLAENVSGLNAARRVEMLTGTSLLPQAEATFQAALSGYQTGQVDFATLLDAQRQILKAKLDVLNAQAEAQVRLAEIEKLLGEEL